MQSGLIHPARRLLEQAEAQDVIAAKWTAKAVAEKDEARRAIHRGNQAVGIALGAHRAANRLRDEAARVSQEVVEL